MTTSDPSTVGDRSLVAPVAPVAPATSAGPKFISCCEEELVEVELDALRQGGASARAHGMQALRHMQAILDAAAVACDRALTEAYLPLDETTFRTVFTRAWCAGYRAKAVQAMRAARSTDT